MFVIDDLKIIEAEALTFGQFAFVEHENSKAFVGKIPNGDPVVIFLDDWESENLAYPHVLSGFAVIVEDAFFEVDIETASRGDRATSKPGSVILDGKKLAVLAYGKEGKPISILVGEYEGSTAPYSVAFSAWRVVRKEGAKLRTLFEMKPRT
ncbi:hypothetical protein [Qipengyuania nanhaisediminis]|uniref:hypothetical protein n=1 Tax=Qipengyuania nanhaisediminis TaxID=604088 RepID=UPI001160B879|nr:hypothetical protein [Qipengyuania nanhaisediminis]